MSDQVAERSHPTIRIQQVVMVLAFILFGLKFAAYTMTRSMAIYTDMLESLVNIVAGLFGLFSLYYAAQPRDLNHPYGHGKIEFVSAIIEGVLIILAGSVIISKVAIEWNDPQTLAQLDAGIWLVTGTAIANFAMGKYAEIRGKALSSPALTASGIHLQSDTYSTIGVVAGLIAVQLSGWLVLDKIIAAVFAVWIAVMGINILRKAMGGIMDKADPELIADLQNYVWSNKRDSWIDIHDMRVLRYGRSIHVDFHMTVAGNMSVRESHDEHHYVKALLKEKYGEDISLIIHFDPDECVGALI